jgi:hypothetical protein
MEDLSRIFEEDARPGGRRGEYEDDMDDFIEEDFEEDEGPKYHAGAAGESDEERPRPKERPREKRPKKNGALGGMGPINEE